MTNPISQELNKKHVLYEQLFSQFQTDCRIRREKYINSEGFQDVKIIFDLYSETFQSKGYNTSNLDEEKITKLLKDFDDFRQRELINFLIEKLKINGNISHASDFEKLYKKKQIKCCWSEIINKKNITKNICLILQKASSYNSVSLLISLAIFIVISNIMFLPAPFKFMEILDITKSKISNDWLINHFANVLMYSFDFNDIMKIEPINIFGVLTLIFLKIFMLLIIINFLIKEFLTQFKL